MFRNIFQLDPNQRSHVIKKFSRSDKAAREYSVVMIDIDKTIAKEMKAMCKKNIADEILYSEDDGFGRETESHVTVKWGFKTDSVKEFKELLKDTKPFEIKFGKISTFEPDDKYHVVIIEIISKELHALNKKLSDNFETHDTFKDYKPHATLCYILPKRCPEVLLNDCPLTGKTMKVTEVIFGDRKGKKTKIKLKQDNE